VLDRGSLKKFGIVERKTGIPVNSELGKTDERIGFGKVNSFEFANIVLADFEAGTLDESVLDRTAPASSGHIDGVFALSQMRKLGAVIDCGHRDLYVNPWGPRSDASGQLAKVLANRGFVRVPMRLNGNGHLEVDCHVNGRGAIITVETAAFATMIDRKLAANAGVSMADDAVRAEGVGHRQAPLESSLVRQFSVGDFQFTKNKIRVGDLTFNVLGIDFLSSNDAVIDTGGMNLFLHQ
jgi:hypothetical protein